VASERPHILGPCQEHILEIARAFGATSGRLRLLPIGMLCRGAASSIRSGSSDCSSGREAAEYPRATDCPRVERPGTSGAPSLRVSTCCRHLAKPGGSTGGTSGLAEAWLPLPALTATAGTDQTCGSAVPGHVGLYDYNSTLGQCGSRPYRGPHPHYRGLVALAGGWKGSEEFVRTLAKLRRSRGVAPRQAGQLSGLSL
jgi:hypothetical protein